MGKTQEAEALVRHFLEALGQRDLEMASSLLASEACLIFPGGKSYKNLNELVKSAKGRYQWVRKTINQLDTVSLPDGNTVVYVIGCLHGVNLHGVAFSDIRFIDRFVLRDGLIISQEVWNDLAESGVFDLKNAPE